MIMPMSADCPKILVVHRDTALSQALMCALSRALEGAHCAAAGCADAAQIYAEVGDFGPDILVLSASGFEFPIVLDCLRVTPRDIRVLVCGLGNRNAEVVAAIQAGAAACDTVESSLEALAANVCSLCRGDAVCPPSVARILYREIAAQDDGLLSACRSAPQLTPRECQIVALIEHGLSNKQIAGELSIGLQTVKNHVHNILDKLHLRRRAEAARYAREKGLLSLGSTGTRAFR
jgi:two-component system, NarL family, nitrate/nitrite response regulator NarL